MSSEFSRKDIDHYLYLVAKEYKRQNRANPNFELVLVGGSSIILNYNFREITTDIDSIIRASSNIKDIINKIGDENGLDPGWLNDDFRRTPSYSDKLVQYSRFYKRFYDCLEVRTVSDAYLLAMKICSYREYKNDISDIIGIIKENKERGTGITYESIEDACKELYGDSFHISDEIKKHLNDIIASDDYEELYYSTATFENENKNLLISAEKKYGGIMTDDNASDFIKNIRSK